jgi:hypothetical protein
MNDSEREAIILSSAWEMIDGMVNWAMFVKNKRVKDVSLAFKTSQSSKLFIILLGDFLSQVRSFKREAIPFDLRSVPPDAKPSDRTFLFHLRQVCANPRLGNDTSRLSATVEIFADWLEEEFTAREVNLHSINLVTDISISRIRYIKMCADIAKHSLPRLQNNANYLQTLLANAGHHFSDGVAYLAFESFFEWFHDHIFNYHSSSIAEYLNNIRWEIYYYLQPEFTRSFRRVYRPIPELPRYDFDTPSEILDLAARAMYWDIMTRSISEPFVQKFHVSKFLKLRY